MTAATQTQRSNAHTLNALRLPSNADRVRFYHAAMGSPPVVTLTKALSAGILPTLPITAKLVRGTQPQTLATAEGHLDAHRQGVQSTRPKPTEERHQQIVDEVCSFPDVDTVRPPDASIILKVYDTKKEIDIDPAGRLPISTEGGGEYHVILYHYDSNYIHVELAKNRTKKELTEALHRSLEYFTNRGMDASYALLDNEFAMAGYKKFFRQKGLHMQLVPPNSHRRNMAERAIRTWKGQFISVLCTTDSNYPFSQCNQLVPQAEMSLNMVRTSRANPYISAWTLLHGAYDFLAHPIAPAGMRVAVHEKPEVRETWGPHALDGFYIGPARDHYRCYQVWLPATNSVRISDALAWFPETTPMPGMSPIDLLSTAIKDFSTLLSPLSNQDPAVRTARQPVAALQTSLLHDLRALRDIYADTPTTEHFPAAQREEPSAVVQRVEQTPPAIQPIPPPSPAQRVEPVSAQEVAPVAAQQVAPAIA
jgi:hypothetical protein